MYPEVKIAATIAVIAVIMLLLFMVGKGMDDDENLDD